MPDRPQRNMESLYADNPNTMGMAGLGIYAENPQRTARRREELTNLATKCCLLFDEYKVTNREKCYVGRLCQSMLEFTV